MAEIIEMPYGNGKSLAGEFIKAYTEVHLDVEIDSRKKIYKNKCRYCGGNLFTHIHRDLNVIGEQGYTVSLKCEDCGMKMSLFASSVDMIPTVESKLLKIYGIKGE